MKAAKWQLEWINHTIKLAKEIWHQHYWPQHLAAESVNEEVSSKASAFGFSSYMDCLLSSVDQATVPSLSLVHSFVHNMLVFNFIDRKQSTFNLLMWWYGQQHVGNEANGLTQMALDVLTAPVSSINFEHAFLFAGLLVSKHQHNLSPHTIQATATLSSYSKAGLVKLGTLVLLLHGKEVAKGTAKVK